MDGQLKTTQPKWEGLTNTNEKMEILVKFITLAMEDKNTYFPPKNLDLVYNTEIYATPTLRDNLKNLIEKIDNITFKFYNVENINDVYYEGDSYNGYTNFQKVFINSNKMNKQTIIGQLLVEIYERINPLLKRLDSIQTTIKEIQFNNNSYNESIQHATDNTSKIKEDFKKYRENIMSDWNYYKKFLFAFYYVIMLIYFIIILGLLIAIICYLILYVCFKKQQEYKFPMFIIWNILRFFTFSMFLYGATTGMLSMVMNDSIGYLIYMFGETNLMGVKTYVVPDGDSKYFINFCLYDEKANLQKFLGLNSLMTDSMLNFYNSLYNLNSITDFSFISNNLNSYSYGYDNLTNYLTDMTYSNKSQENPIKDYMEKLNNISKNEIFTFEEIENDECGSICSKYNNETNNNYLNGLCNRSSTSETYCIVLSKLIQNFNNDTLEDANGFIYINDNATKYFKAIIRSYRDYYNKIYEIQSIFGQINLSPMSTPIKNAIENATNKYSEQIKEFKETYEKNGNVLSFLNCKFLYTDLNIIYYALSELASKTRSLCGITTSMAFFLAIAVYSTIWAMHHYDREIFDGKKKKRRGSKHISSHHHYNHSKTKAIDNNEKYINNINEDSSLSKSKTVKNDNKSRKKKVLNETELSTKRDNEEDNQSLKENMLNSIN